MRYRKIPIADLLRKALVVARKLGLKEFEWWVAKELSGYEETKDVPQYRGGGVLQSCIFQVETI
ncbi:MAG TPA: hypothetical protein DD706_07295 [Nitrospiraceae bacterium]|nr:hypothetical protein [Nitrospiraceae bacterium]